METNEKCCHDSRWHSRIWCYLGYGLLGVVGFALFALIFGWVIMVLWNALIPGLFGLAALSFWQSVGLALLARLLFGTSHMGRHNWRRRHWRHGNCCEGDHGNGHRGFGYGHRHNHKHGDCGCGSGKWQYYEQYWEELGEKSFKEYVDKKSEEDKNKKE